MTGRARIPDPVDARLGMCGMDPQQRHQPSALEQLRADDARAERAIAAAPPPAPVAAEEPSE
jgi:hypothetical protein